MKNHIPAVFGFAILAACLLFGQPVLAAEAPPEDAQIALLV